jgi:general secretion pathway protein I
MTARAHRGAAGFTLLEIAVALAIVGVGVVTVLEIFSAGLRMETAAGTRARAVVYARGLLDQAMTVPEMKAGQEHGVFGDTYRWEVRVREAPEFIDPDRHALDVHEDFTMYEVEIAVLWEQSADREGVYTIRTLRLAPTPTT